jgi:hypothetical protein
VPETAARLSEIAFADHALALPHSASENEDAHSREVSSGCDETVRVHGSTRADALADHPSRIRHRHPGRQPFRRKSVRFFPVTDVRTLISWLNAAVL